MRAGSTESGLKSSARAAEIPHWGTRRWLGWQPEDGGAWAWWAGHSSSGSVEEQWAFDRRQQEERHAGGNSGMWQVWSAGKGVSRALASETRAGDSVPAL